MGGGLLGAGEYDSGQSVVMRSWTRVRTMGELGAEERRSAAVAGLRERTSSWSWTEMNVKFPCPGVQLEGVPAGAWSEDCSGEINFKASVDGDAPFGRGGVSSK